MCTSCINESVPPPVSGAVPTIGTLMLALLPKFGCPLCWPVLAAILGLFGLQIKNLNNIVIVITALMLIVAVVLLLRTKHRTPYILLGISSAFSLACRLALVPAVAAYILMALVAAFLAFRQIQRFMRYAPSNQS